MEVTRVEYLLRLSCAGPEAAPTTVSLAEPPKAPRSHRESQMRKCQTAARRPRTSRPRCAADMVPSPRSLPNEVALGTHRVEARRKTLRQDPLEQQLAREGRRIPGKHTAEGGAAAGQ